MEHSLQGARGRDRQGRVRCCLTGSELSGGDDEKVAGRDGQLHNIMNVFNATELYVYEWLK